MGKKKSLSEKTMKDVCLKLGAFLADSFVLYTKTLNFHWNMEGPQFFMYHKLLEQEYEELAEANDEIAERIRMLGGKAPATLQEFLKLASLSEGKSTQSWEKMIQELVEDHETMVEKCHELIEFTNSVNDEGTSDLIVDRIRSHSKEAWLLRSHLKK